MKKIKENKLLRNSSRKSLVNIFIAFFSTFLILFILLIVTSYYRLTEYKNLLNNMTTTSIPKILESSNVFDQVNELIYLTEKLNKSNSQAFRRITFNSIQEKIIAIKKQGNAISNENLFLSNKLEVIQKELFELNNLIETRLLIEKKLKKELEKINTINNTVNTLYKKNLLIVNNEKNSFDTWRLTFSEIVNLTYQALTLNRLNPLRLTSLELKKLQTKIINDIKNVDSNNKRKIKPHCDSLEKIIFDKEGLLELKAKQLRIKGRAIGRGNFVNNLVMDFSDEIEFSLLQHTSSIVEKSQENVKKAEKEVNYMIYLFIFVLIYLIVISYFIKKQIVQRLINLNENVKNRIKGKTTLLHDSGHDEISHITHSFNYYANKVQEQNKQLEELSLTDGLTGIANRRLFDVRITNELNLVKRNNHTISILLMDIDFFKAYNDNYGHLAGDECLKKISAELKRVIKRDLDLVARYGGEEFVAILSNTNVEDSKLMAQKILDSIVDLKIPHKHSKVLEYISISIGITTVNKNSNLVEDEIIKDADEALYKAKEVRRNCFIHHEQIKHILDQGLY